MNSDEIKEQGRYVKYDDRVIEPILKKHWVNRTMPIGSINMPSSDYDSLGSNAWVIGGEHTQSGRPLLANDPHLGLLIPSLFYMAEFSLVNEKN
jgi:acyl-homoserine lactone acylase PvdQ